jgi:glycosyltransferase involved in cell wall biosynthesis
MFFEVKVMKKPKVSIILPCYNHENYLKERLDSIFNQTYQNFEVIILDDASTDGSQDLLIEYKKHVKVSHHIINTKNSGSPFLQWEKGLELAIGDYVWIAESDDSCDINFLKSNLEKIEQENANICVAKTFKYAKGRTSSEVNHPIFRNKNKENLCVENLNYCPILNVSACIFKNHFLKENVNHEFTNYRLIGDRVFYYEFFSNTDFVKNDDVLAYFRKETESVSTLKYKGIHYLKMYFKEHVDFIKYVDATQDINKGIFNSYINKFFARVRDRLDRKQKLSLTYLSIFLTYKYNLK